MVKAKHLKVLRKKLDRADKFDNPLDLIVSLKHELEWTCPDSRGTRGNGICTNGDRSSSCYNYSIGYASSQTLVGNHELLQKCLDLFHDNMADLYRNSSFGLDMEAKESEIRHSKARFLLVFARDVSSPSSPTIIDSSCDDDPPVIVSSNKASDGDELAAFVHFRFEVDDEDHPSRAVLYVYEVQVDQERHGRRGLGTRLLKLLEQIGRSLQLEQLMLTVLKSNVNAQQFYQKHLDFSIDSTCPSRHGETADYLILSKSLL